MKEQKENEIHPTFHKNARLDLFIYSVFSHVTIINNLFVGGHVGVLVAVDDGFLDY